MKTGEFIKKLEEYVLFPFTDEERTLAVSLAKSFAGKVVLEHWKPWRTSHNEGFEKFADELPHIIRDEEAKRLQLELESMKKEPRKVVYQEEFAGMPKGNWTDMMMQKVAENRQETTGKKCVTERQKPELPGRMDPEQGWMIGNMPVF